MGQRTFSAKFDVSWKQVTLAVLVFVYIAINILRIGGDSFIHFLNDNLIIPLTVGVVAYAFSVWRQVIAQSKNRLLWSGLSIGWALWAIAELWWAIAATIGQEIPYPSWADFFWLVGYIPMFIALWWRFRSLPRNLTPAHKAGIWLAIFLSTAWTILFVLFPIIQDNDPSILMSILNLLYPLVDLALLTLILRILFAYQQGTYGHAWTWLSAGFAVHSLSNLIFSYASTLDLYYPDGRATLLSTIAIDFPYNLSYLFWLIGLMIVRTIQMGHRAFTEVDFNLVLVPNTHVLVSTKGDDTVIEVSQNYWRVFPVQIIKGKTILETIGISPGDASSLLEDLKADSLLKERKVLVNTSSGPQQALVSGLAVRSPQGEYSGVTLLLRMLTDTYGLDELLTEYQKGMVVSLLAKTGTKQVEDEEVKQLLSNYYLYFLKGFYNRVYSEGGSIMTDALLTDLQSIARRHEWQVGIHPDLLLDVSALSLPTTRQALPVLLEAAKRFVTKTIDEPVANSIVQDIRSRLDDRTLLNINYFDKAETNPV